MELLTPKPLCSVVNCEDLEKLDHVSALNELRREQEIFKLLPGIYAHRYDFRRVSPSIINDFEYCPRLLWVQHKLGLKLLSEKSVVSIIRGRILHERYERLLSQYENVVAEYKVEIGDLVGVVDLVIKRGGEYIPVEIKTGFSKEAHKTQLQIYISMLKARFGYLVYRNHVEVVHRNDAALDVLKKIREILSAREAPPAKCNSCIFKPICKNLL